MYVALITYLLLFIGVMVILGYNLPSQIRYRKFNGKFESFWFGSLTSFRKIGQYNFYTEYRKKYGDTFVIWIGRVPRFYTSNPETYKKISSLPNRMQLQRPGPQEIKENPLQSNIVTARKERWQDIRAIQQPAFNPQATSEYFGSIFRSIKGALQDVEKAIQEKNTVDVLILSKYITTTAIMESAFGLQFDIQKEDDRNTIKHLSQLTKLTLDNTNSVSRRAIMTTISLFPEIIGFLSYIGVPMYKVISVGLGGEIGKYVMEEWINNGYNDKFFKNRESDVKLNPLDQEANSQNNKMLLNSNMPLGNQQIASPLSNFKNWKEHEGPGLWMKLVQSGLVNGEPLNKAQVETNVQIMMIAGHDTTATTIGMALYSISKNKKIEAMVLKEIDQYGSDKEINQSSLDKFPYTEAVVKETLRMYPPAQLTTRSIDVSNLQVEGIKVPKGTQAVLHIKGMHYNEKYWPQPEEFIPQRFLNDPTYSQKHPQAYQPFGFGPRMCLGWRFAMMEALLTLVLIYQQYYFDIPSDFQDKDLDFTVDATIQLKKPIKLIPNKRLIQSFDN